MELGYSVTMVAESRSRACSNDPCGVSGGSWPFRIMMRVLCDCGPRLCGLGFIVSDMHSQSLCVFMSDVAWLHCGHVCAEGKLWLCLALISAACWCGCRCLCLWSIGSGLWISAIELGVRQFIVAALCLATRYFDLSCGLIAVICIRVVAMDRRKVLTLIVSSVSLGRSAAVIRSVVPWQAFMWDVQSFMYICVVGGIIPVSCSSHAVCSGDSGMGMFSRWAIAEATVESSLSLSFSVRIGPDRP